MIQTVTNDSGFDRLAATASDAAFKNSGFLLPSETFVKTTREGSPGRLQRGDAPAATSTPGSCCCFIDCRIDTTVLGSL